MRKAQHWSFHDEAGGMARKRILLAKMGLTAATPNHHGCRHAARRRREVIYLGLHNNANRWSKP
jgi:hypothetical protein